MRPTTEAMPFSAIRSRFGCGRSCSSRKMTGRFGAEGRFSSCGRPRNSRHAAISSSADGFRREPDADGFRMPIAHGNARAGRADREGRGAELPALPVAEHLRRLGLQLLFLAADVRHDIVDQIERRHARIARAGGRLQARDDHRLDAECAMQGRERQDERDRRAVAVRDDEPLGAEPLALRVQRFGVIAGSPPRPSAARPRPCGDWRHSRRCDAPLSPAAVRHRPPHRTAATRRRRAIRAAHPAPSPAGPRHPAGISGETSQFAASAYGLPTERSDATSSRTANHGCPSSNWMNRCPTAPVAPSTATPIFSPPGGGIADAAHAPSLASSSLSCSNRSCQCAGTT